MKYYADPQETIAGTTRRLRAGETTCEEVLRACLGQIDEKEPAVRAWVVVDRDGALAQAQALDEELKAGGDRGPLHGIPIGIKDIIDVRGLPTQCGLAGRRWLRAMPPADADAPLVARLRKAGAVIVGKTVSTPFAWIDTPVTRNPWNFDRTPGGSSSGSAAAVACGMCLGAIGTQTGGSIIRPASFCGVAGLKPTHGHVSTKRVVPLAPSLDHAGPIARTVEDLELLYHVLRKPKYVSGDEDRGFLGSDVPRLVRITQLIHFESSDAIAAAVDELRRRCGPIPEASFPVELEGLLRCHRTILAAEAAASHGPRQLVMSRYFEDEAQAWIFPEQFQALLIEGRRSLAVDYLSALKLRRSWAGFRDGFPPFDAIVTPATLGAAPDTTTTGDPALNSPWSLLGLPVVSFPVGLSADGMPLAVQLIGRAHDDLALLRVACWCESVIRSRGDSSR